MDLQQKIPARARNGVNVPKILLLFSAVKRAFRRVCSQPRPRGRLGSPDRAYQEPSICVEKPQCARRFQACAPGAGRGQRRGGARAAAAAAAAGCARQRRCAAECGAAGGGGNERAAASGHKRAAAAGHKRAAAAAWMISLRRREPARDTPAVRATAGAGGGGGGGSCGGAKPARGLRA